MNIIEQHISMSKKMLLILKVWKQSIFDTDTLYLKKKITELLPVDEINQILEVSMIETKLEVAIVNLEKFVNAFKVEDICDISHISHLFGEKFDQMEINYIRIMSISQSIYNQLKETRFKLEKSYILGHTDKPAEFYEIKSIEENFERALFGNCE
jgi:hypothetical protein